LFKLKKVSVVAQRFNAASVADINKPAPTFEQANKGSTSAATHPMDKNPFSPVDRFLFFFFPLQV